MPMMLEGSCRCGAVRFGVASHTPQPYQLCYCSICRKTAGGGGFAINLGALAASLKVVGRRHLRIWQATIREADRLERSPAQRHFCARCASALWLFDPRWPDLLHPFASAIDTPLPVPPSRVHLMLADKPAWVVPQLGPDDACYDGYPELSIEAWHKQQGLWIP